MAPTVRFLAKIAFWAVSIVALIVSVVDVVLIELVVWLDRKASL